MDGQSGEPMCGTRIFCHVGGSRPDGQNTGSAFGTNTYARTNTHAHVQTGT